MRPPAPRPPAPKPPLDRGLARDVAKHLDRTRRRRKLFVWALLLTAIVLAALHLTCGRGWGLGGKGKGAGPGSGPGSGSGSVQAPPPIADAGPRRCDVRVAAGGITVGGRPATLDEAVAACRETEAAEIRVTGGARRGDREDVQAAFERAGIQILWVEPKGAGSGS